MAEGTNPLLPTGWEFSILAFGLCHVALVIFAIISLTRNKTLAPATKFLCLLAILAFPLLGPAAWFLHLYRSRSYRRATGPQGSTDRPEKISR